MYYDILLGQFYVIISVITPYLYRLLRNACHSAMFDSIHWDIILIEYSEQVHIHYTCILKAKQEAYAKIT